MRAHRAIALFVLLAVPARGAAGRTGPDVPADILAGASYFAGWWRPTPGKWQGPDGRDWRPRFPERRPLLGEYGDQATVDREIRAAAEHGVDFFAILWYPPGKDPSAPLLDRGLEGFLRSREAHRLEFLIEFCNHPPFGVRDDAAWAECVETWTEAMRHPSALRVGGRLLFKVHGGRRFLEQNGGDPARCRRRLDRLRAAARSKGLGELWIGCGVDAREPIPAGHPLARIFDFTATYMSVPPLERGTEHPYRVLLEFAREGWRVHRKDAIPYVPHLPAGWDPRPWGDPRPSFAPPTRAEWLEALRAVREALRATPRFGLPLPGGGRRKLFTIYAWNEFGEGGFVAPTRGDGYMKLEGIREVFGEGLRRHPVPRGHPRLFGSLRRLRRLARERPDAYGRMVRVAREREAGDHEKMFSMALVAAIEAEYRRRAAPALELAGDGTRAYAPAKMERFTRQIVFLRPGTFVIFDRVKARRPEYGKTWLLQAMAVPAARPPHLVITNGRGRLFVQTLLPRKARVGLVSGPDLYGIGDRTYPPRRDTGPAPACRIEVSPPEPSAEDLFLHVLTATEATVSSVPPATPGSSSRCRGSAAGSRCPAAASASRIGSCSGPPHDGGRRSRAIPRARAGCPAPWWYDVLVGGPP